jgi:hypothetical protein
MWVVAFFFGYWASRFRSSSCLRSFGTRLAAATTPPGRGVEEAPGSAGASFLPRLRVSGSGSRDFFFVRDLTVLRTGGGSSGRWDIIFGGPYLRSG